MPNFFVTEFCCCSNLEPNIVPDEPKYFPKILNNKKKTIFLNKLGKLWNVSILTKINWAKNAAIGIRMELRPENSDSRILPPVGKCNTRVWGACLRETDRNEPGRRKEKPKRKCKRKEMGFRFLIPIWISTDFDN